MVRAISQIDLFNLIVNLFQFEGFSRLLFFKTIRMIRYQSPRFRTRHLRRSHWEAPFYRNTLILVDLFLHTEWFTHFINVFEKIDLSWYITIFIQSLVQLPFFQHNIHQSKTRLSKGSVPHRAQLYLTLITLCYITC